MDPRQKAKQLLLHYFTITWGGRWDSDCRYEIESIIDWLMEEVGNEYRTRTRGLYSRIEDLEDRIEKLESCAHDHQGFLSFNKWAPLPREE